MKAFLIHNVTTGKYVEYGNVEDEIKWTGYYSEVGRAGYFTEHKAIEIVERLCKDNLDGYIFTIIPIWV